MRKILKVGWGGGRGDYSLNPILIPKRLSTVKNWRPTELAVQLVKQSN